MHLFWGGSSLHLLTATVAAPTRFLTMLRLRDVNFERKLSATDAPSGESAEVILQSSMRKFTL